MKRILTGITLSIIIIITTLPTAALADAGIVYLPTFIIGDDIAAGRLELLLEDHVPQLHSAYAVYPASRHLSPKVRAMIDFLVESFGSRPPWDAYLGEQEENRGAEPPRREIN